MYKVLGIINIVLIVVVTSPYWLRKLNQWLFHIKSPKFNAVLRVLRKFHKPLALALIVIIPIHGYLALGSFRMHTGTIAWIAALVTVALGGTYYYTKKPAVFKWHKAMALVFVILVIVHLLFPSLFSYIG